MSDPGGNAEPATHPIHSSVTSAVRARMHALVGSPAHGAIKGSTNRAIRERCARLPSLITATMMNQMRGRSGTPFVGTISPAGSRNRFLTATRRVALIKAPLQDHSFSPRAIKRVISTSTSTMFSLLSGDRETDELERGRFATFSVKPKVRVSDVSLDFRTFARRREAIIHQ